MGQSGALRLRGVQVCGSRLRVGGKCHVKSLLLASRDIVHSHLHDMGIVKALEKDCEVAMGDFLFMF